MQPNPELLTYIDKVAALAGSLKDYVDAVAQQTVWNSIMTMGALMWCAALSVWMVLRHR